MGRLVTEEDKTATEGSEIAMPSWPMIEYRAKTWCLLVTHSSSHVRLAMLRMPSPTFCALYHHHHHQEYSIAIESIAYILNIITLAVESSYQPFRCILYLHCSKDEEDDYFSLSSITILR
jgi:hypothetical protein